MSKETFDSWKKDLSRSKLVEDRIFPGNVALVEVYKEVIEDPNERRVDLIQSAGGGKIKRSSDELHVHTKPIAKVLALGNNIYEDYDSLKVGSIVYLPDRMKNTEWSPEFLMLLQESTSNKEAVLPEGINKKIATFVKVLNERMYMIDKFAEPSQADTLTFLIPLNSVYIDSIEK